MIPVLLFLLLISSIASIVSASMSTFSRSQVLGWWWTNKAVLNVIDSSSSMEALPQDTPAMSASDLASELRKSMLRLKSEFITGNGEKVDYAAMRSSDAFKEYVKLSSLLQTVDLASFPNESSKKGFLINIYNCLCIHALCEGLLSSFPGGSLSRLKLYASSSYNIGGVPYSLNDIENGLLRNNKKSAAPFSSVPFGDDDPRKQYCLNCDERIHFALNCGAKSCPPIAVYSVDDESKLNNQLDLACKGFLSQPSNVDLDTEGKIGLSMIFKWYQDDFCEDGGSNEQLIGWIARNAPGERKSQIESVAATSPQVTWLEYDWGLNQ